MSMTTNKKLNHQQIQEMLFPTYNFNDQRKSNLEANFSFLYSQFLQDKIYNMNEQKQYLYKPVKSLSARAFAKSARKQGATRRNDTMPTQPAELFTQTKRHNQLQAKSSRLLAFAQGQPKRSGVKPPEQLQEQNNTLKMKINQLNSVLGKERSKNEHDKKNYSRVHEKLNIEFADERYFDLSAKNSSLVEGVKYQYYKMKQKYEEKCAEYDALLQNPIRTTDLEATIHIQALQNENAKLRNRLVALLTVQQKMEEELKKQNSNRGKSRQEGRGESRTEYLTHAERQDDFYQILGLSAQFTLLEKKVVDGEYRIDKLQQKIAVLRAKLKEKTKRLQFLDKLLIQKANQVHHAVLKERRTAKEFKIQGETLERLRKLLKEQEEQYDNAIAALKQKENFRFETEKNIFSTCLREKDTEIQKLKHEVHYLSTIISYIRTGQDPFKIEKLPTSLSHKNSYKEQSSQFLQNLQRTLISIEGDNPTTRKRVKTLIQSGFKQVNSPRNQVNTETLKIIQIASDSEQEGESVPGSLLRNTQLEDPMIDSRVPKKSYIKHSEDALKVRPVKLSQIENLKKQLVFRFMFYKLTIDEVRDFFNFSEETTQSRKEKKWRVQYANLKQIKEKLQSYPFDLKQEQALLLARYIVEDCTKDNVYYHQENEVERSIAKSILRAFVGEYTVPIEDVARQQIRQLLKTSGRNLQSALSSLEPSGFISATKFCEICMSIQVDFSEETRDYILSQMLAKSNEGLSHLRYSLIFESLAS